MAHDTIDQIARRLADSLPQGIRNMRDDLEHNFRGILQSGLTRLDLVTREEFDVQQSVLARTREKLEALESRLGALQEAAVTETSAGPAAKQPKKTAASKKAATKKSTKKKSTKKKSTRKKSTRKKTAKKQSAKKKAAKTTKKSGR